MKATTKEPLTATACLQPVPNQLLEDSADLQLFVRLLADLTLRSILTLLWIPNRKVAR